MSQPIPLEDFVALAITLGLPVRGSQSKVTKFLDDQVRVTYPGEMIFGSDSEYAGSSFPGSCKREPSLGSTFFFVFLYVVIPDIRKLYFTHITIAILFCCTRFLPCAVGSQEDAPI